MKKLIILLTALTTIVTVGCTNTKVEKSATLKEAYFSIGERIENNEDVSEEYITELLNGYTYEKGDVIQDDINEYKSNQHIFINDNEKLIIGDSTTGDDKHIDLLYEFHNDISTAFIAYSSVNVNNGLYTNVSVSDEALYNQASEIMDIKQSEVLKQYNSISNNILSGKEITINEVKENIDIELTHEVTTDPNTSIEVDRYFFNTDSEGIGVYCIKGQEKVSKIVYGLSNTQFIKTTMEKELTPNNTINTSLISTNVDSIEIQKKILDIILQ